MSSKSKPLRSLKTRREPSPVEESGKTEESPAFFVVVCISGYWRCYIDDRGDQLFTSTRAAQLKQFLEESNPKGWNCVELAEVGRCV